MENKHPYKPYTALILLGGTALLEFILLFESFRTAFSAVHGAFFAAEAFFLVAAAAGAVFSAFRPDWGGRPGALAVWGIFAVYTVWSLLTFSLFSAEFAKCFAPQYGRYYGMAMQAGKLFVIFIGIASAGRSSRRPDTHAYTAALDTVSQRKQLEWAIAAEKGSKKDAQRTVENLKAQLGEAEFARLINQLETDSADKTGRADSE